MIEAILSDKAYENDVYPLVKAFYPEETVKIYGLEEYQKEDLISVGTQRLFLDLHRLSIRIDMELAEVAKSSDILELSNTLSRSEYKNAMKRFLYQKLSMATKLMLPWGILTGIRPTKLVYELLQKNLTEDAIYQRMREEYLCSDEKIALSITIAKRELELLEEMDYQAGYSIYIGIPFCPSTCLYCSFTSYSAEKYAQYIASYLEALEKELRALSNSFPDKRLTCVYLGGGTPTTLSAEQLDYLLGLVKELFDFTYVKEFCVEAGRPDSITKEKLEVLKEWGVDRISINPQSMQQKTLDLIGRKHTTLQVREAFELARETGHMNINMDIILGLPEENRRM